MVVNRALNMSSTVRNIIAAGQASGRASAELYDGVRDNSVNYTDIHIANMKARAGNKIAAMKASEKVKLANIEKGQRVQDAKIDVKADKAVAAGNKQQRMAGVLAAAGGKVGTGIYLNSPEKRSNKYAEAHAAYIQKLQDKLNNYESRGPGAAEQELTRQLTALEGNAPTPITSGAGSLNTGGGTASTGGTTGASSQLTGVRKEFADAIAGPESGSWGYEAFNQGGAEGGTKVLGKSGSHKEVFGHSLTDMTLGQIFARQNGPKETHYQDGGLHAVGRYQFIGDTLREEVDRMGLSHDTKFTPDVQDQIFFSHAKRVGSISPWIGPSVHYDADKRAHLNSLIPQL